MNRTFKFFVIFLSFYVGFCAPLFAQNGENTATSTASASAAVVDSSVSVIVPKAAALEEEISKLPEKIAELTATASLIAELDKAQNKYKKSKSKLEELKSSGLYSFDQLSEIRLNARENQQFIEKSKNQITSKIKSLEQLRHTWQNHLDSWKNLGKTLETDSEAVKLTLKEIEIKLANTLTSLDGVEAPWLEIQKNASEISQLNQSHLDNAFSIIQEMRKDLFRKSRPAMFTPSFIKQFDKTLWEEFWLGIASLKLPEEDFFLAQGWIFSLQFLGILIFIWLFSSIDSDKAKQIRLDFLINRKFSASIVAGIALFYPLFEGLPNIIRVILWTFMSIGGARLIAGIVESVARRKLIYVLAGLFLASHFSYLINLPSPIFRIYVALVGLAGALVCFWRVRLNKLEKISMWLLLAAKVGGLTMLLVFLSQVAGYAGFANHLLEVAIKTVFFLLIVWIAAVILRGIAEALLDNIYIKRSQIFQKHSDHIIKRVKVLINILSVFFAISGLFPIWGIQDSFSDSAYRILSLGFALQGEKITLGIIVGAIALLYLSIFASWLIQRVLDEEIYPRKNVEPGVGISINRLIHYAFVIIGSVIAMSTIGIGLQSLAVLMGAFGIGIGFGLQNIVSNFASGLILLFERSIKVGDVVIINGQWGRIKNLGLRSTVVETFDRSELIVPNSDLVSNTVTNWTLTDRQIRIIVKVGVAYGSDVELVKSILSRVAQENPFIMKFPEPSILFMGFGDSSLDFELRVFVSDVDYMLTMRSELNSEIDRLFRENNIEIPFPQNDLHIRTMDESFQSSVKGLLQKTEKSDS
jgi:small-conductance mechanosensitive channel